MRFGHDSRVILVKRPRMWRGLLALKCELFIVCLFQGRDNIVSFSFTPFIPTRGVPGRFVDFIRYALDTEANVGLREHNGSAASGYDYCITHCTSWESESRYTSVNSLGA